MSRIDPTKVSFTADDRELEKGYARIERNAKSFLKRLHGLEVVGRAAAGGFIGSRIVSAPFEFTRAFTATMASASQQAEQAFTDQASGRIKNVADSGFPPVIAAGLAARRDENDSKLRRRDAAFSLFATEATRGDGIVSKGVDFFNQALRGSLAAGGAFLANAFSLEAGAGGRALRQSDLAAQEAMATDDSWALYWAQIRAQEGGAGAQDDLDKYYQRIKDRQSAGNGFKELRKSLSGV